jgi:hypothetical protein
VWGVTHKFRKSAQQMTREEYDRLNEINRVRASAPDDPSRRPQGPGN